MIVNTMTFDEITDYLLKNCFPKSRVDALYEKLMKINAKKYRREILKWKQNPSHPKYKFFLPLTSKDEYEQELVMVPFATTKDYVDFVIFTQFHYRGRKYVAMKLVNNVIWYFSWHTLERYAERFLGDKEMEITLDFIGKMLVRNCGAKKTEYIYKGRKTNMYVSTDGSFLTDEYEKCIVANTFISQNEYFENQTLLDGPAFEELKKYRKENYGYWLQRG